MSRRGCFALILLLVALLPACREQVSPPTRILLQVGERSVSLVQFQHDFEQVVPKDRELSGDELQALRRSYLAQRIDRELLLAEADRLQLRVTPEELRQAMDTHLDHYPPGEFKQMLDEKGQSVEDWQRLLTEELLVEKVLSRQVRNKIAVTDEAIAAYFTAHRLNFVHPEQVRARQITVADEATGRQALESLRQGMAFADAARSYSISPDAELGGDLGTFARGEMPEAFDRVVFALPAGRISDLVNSEYGYHIFLVEEHLPARQPALAANREEITTILRRQQEEELYQSWLQELRQKASIEVDWTLL